MEEELHETDGLAFGQRHLDPEPNPVNDLDQLDAKDFRRVRAIADEPAEEPEAAASLDLERAYHALAEHRPGCVVVESITNPMLRVTPLDSVVEAARRHGALVVVDSTFATPLLVRPLKIGVDFVIHSLTKYLGGHGDVLGGVIVAREEFRPALQSISRTVGGVLGPFEAYLAMRGIKTFPLRMARQCASACRVAAWLASHPRIERVIFPGDPNHPDAAVARRLFPPGLYGAMVSFEVKGAGKEEIFRLVDALRMIVPATSLGDVHSMILYPPMSSHRDLAPKHRQRMGIGDSFLRLSVGIEAPEDIIEDLQQALERP